MVKTAITFILALLIAVTIPVLILSNIENTNLKRRILEFEGEISILKSANLVTALG